MNSDNALSSKKNICIFIHTIYNTFCYLPHKKKSRHCPRKGVLRKFGLRAVVNNKLKIIFFATASNFGFPWNYKLKIKT